MPFVGDNRAAVPKFSKAATFTSVTAIDDAGKVAVAAGVATYGHWIWRVDTNANCDILIGDATGTALIPMQHQVVAGQTALDGIFIPGTGAIFAKSDTGSQTGNLVIVSI